MTGVSLMVADMLTRQAGMSADEARTFAESACEQWLDNMSQRIEHASGYEFHLSPERIGRKHWYSQQ
jgi:hypothetical protein